MQSECPTWPGKAKGKGKGREKSKGKRGLKVESKGGAGSREGRRQEFPEPLRRLRKTLQYPGVCWSCGEVGLTSHECLKYWSANAGEEHEAETESADVDVGKVWRIGGVSVETS